MSVNDEYISIPLKIPKKLKIPYFEENTYKVNLIAQFYDFVYPFLLEKNLIDKNFFPVDLRKYFMVEGPYFYKKFFIQEGNIVIDAGANIGVFSCLAAFLGGIVYAFEPVAEIREKYLRKCGEIYSNINVVPYALSNKKGVVDIFIPDMVRGTIIPIKQDNSLKKKKIYCISLDEWVDENGIRKIDFIKADIEGAERLMLKGAYKTLKKFAPKLSICTYHLKDDKKVLTELILKANSDYKIVYTPCKLFAWVEK